MNLKYFSRKTIRECREDQISNSQYHDLQFFPLSRFFWLLELIDSKRNKISQRFQFQLISKSTQLENLFDSNKEKTKLGIGKFEISVIFHELHNHYKKSHSFPEIVEIPHLGLEQPKKFRNLKLKKDECLENQKCYLDTK